MAHINLLCDISEIGWVFSDSSGMNEYLRNLVVMVARHMQAEVCSVYLYDAASEALVLRANHGLNPDLIDKIRLKSGEGITGSAFEEMRPIRDNHASSNPNYRFFGDLHEEKFDAFLAVPIVRGVDKIGVLVLQRKAGHDFVDDELITLRAVANQLANILENARELMALREATLTRGEKNVPALLKLVRGKTASGGFARGGSRLEMNSRSIDELVVPDGLPPPGLEAFQAAVAATRSQLAERQRAVEERLSDVASLIFTAHLMLLQDDLFYGKIVDRITMGERADTALLDTARHYIGFFASQDNPLLREKADDIRDLAVRVFENLCGKKSGSLSYDGSIVIARDLLPSDILVLSSEKVAGIVLIGGGVTSHIAVLARSLGLPLIIADDPRLLDIAEGTLLALDGDTGNVYVNPTDAMLASFVMREKARRERDLAKGAMSPETFTTDRVKITLLANINLLSDAKTAVDLACEGVGLYRTEFPFIIRNSFPSEEEQVVVYRKLVEEMANRPVTFRTIDIGGDKILSYYHHFTEQNPFLGLRSIRFALSHIDVFRSQLRAILRAGCDADLNIMFPMITTLEELDEARANIHYCIDELRREGRAFNAYPRIGVMIEIPAMVEIIDALAEQVDFFSIGTNDFVQYMLAVDRTNEKVASLYLPHHPAVLRALSRIVSAATLHGKPVSVCGDMAHQTQYISYLLGIGVRSLSVDAMYLPNVQRCVSAISIDQAEKTAAAALHEHSLEKIAAILGFSNIV